MLKHSATCRLYWHGGIEMNLAFALNTYNQTKASSEANKQDGYEAVKYALDQVIGSMEKLNSGLDTAEKSITSNELIKYLFSPEVFGFRERWRIS